MNTKTSLKAKTYLSSTMRVLTLFTLVVNAVAFPIATVQAQSPAVKVGFVTDVGGLNDQSGWNALINQGLVQAENDLGVVGTRYEPTTEDDYETLLQQCVNDGNDLCIGSNFMLDNAIANIALLNPGTNFLIVDMHVDGTLPNLRGVQFDIKQVGYLAGALAGKLGSTMGVVGGMEISPVTGFVEGFRNGAQCSNPDANVFVNYTGTFVDPELGAAVAQDMIAQGANVIFGVGGQTGKGAILYSAQDGKWSIGVDMDQYLTVFDNGNVSGSYNMVTSAMKNLDFAVYQTIQDHIYESFASGTVIYDLEDGGVALAPYHETDARLTQPTKDYVNNVQMGIIDGSIDVNSSCRYEPPLEPMMTFFTAWNGIVAGQWPLDIPVQITVDDLDPLISPDFSDTVFVPENPDEPGSTRLIYDFPESMMLQPGYTITLDNGQVIRTLVVSSLQITSADLETDIVSGIVEPYAEITVIAESSGAERYAAADASGNWSVDFKIHGNEGGNTELLHDIIPGDHFRAMVGDDDGDITFAEWSILNPSFTVLFDSNWIDGYEWPLGNEVTLYINGEEIDKQTPSVADWYPNQTFIRFDLGDSFTLQVGQAIELTNGTLTKTHTITDLEVTSVDPDTDRVYGTAAPGTEIYVGHFYCDENGCFGFRREFADSNRNWMADFSVVGEDDDEQDIVNITRGMSSMARQCDQDGDCTQREWHVPDPNLQVFITQDRIEARDWPFGNQVTLTINDLDPETTDYTETRTVGPASWNPNENVAEFDLNGIYHYKVGDIITVTDGTLTKMHTVRAVAVTGIDTVAETISGTTDPGAQVFVEIHRPDGTHRIVNANGAGQWTVDFSMPWNDQGTYDLDPGLNGAAMLYDPDGDASRADWRIPNPTFGVRANTDQIEGWEWPLGTMVTVTVDDPGTPEEPDITRTADVYDAPWNPGEHRFDLDLRGEFDIQPGFVVTVSDGFSVKEHTVLDIYFTSVDVDADIVYGKGLPERQVNVWTCDNYGCINREEFADESGDWSSNFAVPGDQDWENETANLRFGSWIDSSVNDEDGDSTMYGVNYNPTAFTVVPYDPNSDPRNIIVGWDWEVGTTVNLCIENPPYDDQCEYTDSQTVPSEPNGFAGFQFEFNIDPSVFQIAGGQRVTLYNDVRTVQHVVTNLRLLWVDWDADTVGGTADPGSEVGISAHGDNQSASRWVITNSEGNWSADFANPGDESDEQDTLDLQLGHHFFIPGQGDENGSSTQFWWQPPNPFIEASSNSKWVHARGWPFGTQITLTINGSSDTYTATIGPAPWDPNDFVADFDLQGYDIQPGDVITGTGNDTTKTLVVSELSITSYDIDADTISGVGTPGTEVEICVNFPDHCASRHVMADEVTGEWTVNYADPGPDDQETVDLQPGSNGWAAEYEADSDRTWYDWGVPNPNFAVRVNANWVEANEWALGSSLTLEIDDPDNGLGVDYTDTQTVEEASWDQNQTYIEIQFEGLYDVQPGDVVTLTDGVTSKTHIVTSIEIRGYDLDSDLVFGVADPYSYNLLVYACNNEYCSTRHVDSDSYGNWTADFGNPGTLDDEQDTYDIVNGTWLDSQQGDEDGDFTFNGMSVPSYTLHAVPAHPEVHGHDWPWGADVTLIIDDDNNPDNGTLYEDTRNVDDDPWCGNPCFDLDGIFDLQVGQYVTMTDGNVSRTVQVSVLTITDVDYMNDILRGIADPGSRVAVNIWSQDGLARYVTTESDGTWEADFSVFGDEDFEQFTTDIGYGDNGHAIQLNPDGTDDGTLEYWNIPNPNIQVRANFDLMKGYEWPAGATVTIEIDDPGTPAVSPDYSDTVTVGTAPWDPNQTYFELPLWDEFDIQPGFVVTATDGVTIRQHTVVNLEFTDIDVDADTVTGTAAPDSQIDIWACEFNNCFNINGVPVDGSGNWSADFQGIHNIQPGTWIDSVQYDAQGNGTMFGIQTPGAEIAGTIYAIENVPGNEAGGVMVEACNTDQSVCRNALTDENGNYTLAYLPKGEFDLKAYPAGNELPGYSDMPINITDYVTYYAEYIVLPGPPTPPPSGAVEPAHEGGGTIVVYIGDPLTLTTHGDTGGTATYEITVYEDGYTDNGPMVETPAGSGTYIATIPPLVSHHGVAEIVYTITYADKDPDVTSFFIYIDPSGVVQTVEGVPIVGATVTLLRSDNPDGPFEVVPDGSVIMSPSNRTNPDATDEDGRFGWDVMAGFYIVRAEFPGCYSPDDPSQLFMESEVLIIPPPVTDLVLELVCPNLPPRNVVITAPVDPLQISELVTVHVDFTDPDENDDHTIVIRWGDGTTTTVSVAGMTGVAEHQYQSAGVYTIEAVVTDPAGESAQATYEYVVIYDPEGGFVTGGGWIWSPEGAYTPDPSLIGKATFGFVSKYKKGASIPTGSTEFQFKVADLNFKSTSYDWLVIAGSKAQYKGTGTINGAGEYKFMLSAMDGSPDKFRIKIWNATTGVVLYDNMLNTVDTADPLTILQGGSIVIHKAK